MIELDIRAIGAACYTGNAHKWMFAPKGSAFLHVRRDRQERVRPIVISHGATSPRTDRSRFRLEHDWTGTLDPTPWLSVPAAIEFGARLMPGGWDGLRARGHELALVARDLLGDAVGVPPPASDEMIGAMAAVPLPLASADEAPPAATYDDPVHAALLADGLQVAVSQWPQRPDGAPWQRVLRVSTPPYVDRDDLERLARAVATLQAAV